jgi:hypothetical protein
MASTRLRGRITAVITAALAVMVASAPAAAGAPEPVEIESTMLIGGAFNVGDFTTTSGSDLICESGSVIDTRYVWGASQGAGGNPHGLNLQVDKTFDCGDGLVFTRLQIRGVLAEETFLWTVLGGTGAYSGLHGGGTGWTDTSDFGSCTCVVNYYSGSLIE